MSNASAVSVPAPEPQPMPDRAPEWVAAGTPEPLRSRLTAALGPDRVLTRALDLVAYASDASPYRLIPQAVAVPRDVEDVVTLLRCAAELGAPLVFRAGGTSLNGQAQTDSILVDVRRHWRRVEIEAGGARARAESGAVLGHVNRRLARHGRRLGPDPASASIACVGGVVANNSGGMRCGVIADSYRTVSAVKFVLANGAVIDTAAPDAEQTFAAAAPELTAGLMQIRDELRGDAELAARVASKFQIKNTTGYRLCAFLEADSPLEIFRRLLVGSEGTLAFLAEAVFETVPLGRHATLALVGFTDLDAAAGAVGKLVAAGATATELMVAPTLIAAAYNMPGTPESWKALPPSSAALLIEFRADLPKELEPLERAAREILVRRSLLDGPADVRFSQEPEEIEMLWRVREGMQGLLAAMRPPGVTMIIEDVCVPPARIAEAARDLQALLSEHGFLPGLAGHASAGNLHFLLTPNFGQPEDLERYDAFIHALVELIVGKYDGSLKAEHGTGINMAPFVAREWGERATEMMWRIKQLADPASLLGPGVVLNRDPGAHLRNFKTVPEVEASVTKCIECGFCEGVCPSQNLTTTPRQRIVLRREMARQPPGSAVLSALLEQYAYDGLQTCAADGSCQQACPVAIDTGQLVKELRHRQHDERSERLGLVAARGSAGLERLARGGLRVGNAVSRTFGHRAAAALPSLLRERVGDELVPAWAESMPRAAPGRLPRTRRAGASAVYMPACINRILGAAADEPDRLAVPEAIVALSQRAGRPVWIPDDIGGHCCATPWSSKGFGAGREQMATKTGAALERWSDGGRLPVVIDASSCTLGVLQNVAPAGIEVIDSVSWVHDRLLEGLEIPRRLGSMLVHPTCAASQLGVSVKLSVLAARMADEVVIPAGTRCCGMAGDRGWLHPELPRSALGHVAEELGDAGFDACVSSNRTCELALRTVTGRPYASFVLTLEELTR